MREFRNEFIVEAPIARVFDFHLDINNLLEMTPPDWKVEILRADVPIRVGSHIDLNVKSKRFSSTLKTIVTRSDPPHDFTDMQISGIFKSWIHNHHFEEISDGRTRVTDLVRYELPLGLLGRFLGRGMAERRLRDLFEHRREMTARLLEGK